MNLEYDQDPVITLGDILGKATFQEHCPSLASPILAKWRRSASIVIVVRKRSTLVKLA
jgi:hypothetical protein